MAKESCAREPHRACEAREEMRLSPVSLSVFSLIPDLLFDCSRVLEHTKIRTVLQSIVVTSPTTGNTTRIMYVPTMNSHVCFCGIFIAGSQYNVIMFILFRYSTCVNKDQG